MLLFNIKNTPLNLRISAQVYRIYSAYSSVADEIVIPKRINRGPTSILRALESTITDRDPTATHFKYQDDPYMIPTSNITKRVYAMSQESGRKAAHWVKGQNPQLFQHKEACPEIPAFLSQKIYSDDVKEADLNEAIKLVRVSNAVQIYKTLLSKKVEICNETLEEFLEMLCYCNGSEVLSEELVEERWFRQNLSARDKARKTWLDNGTAEEVFIAMQNPNARSYSALICGMCKFYQVQRAHELYTEANSKNISLSPDAYNGLISCANFLQDNFELRWRFISELLETMKDKEVKPNLGTLNAVLESLSMMGTSNNTKQLVLRTLKELRMCNVEPTLGSWYYVLVAYCKPHGPVSTILHDILPLLENKEHKIQAKADVNFFVTAMDICCNHLKDKKLAKRVHTLLLHKNNYDLIGDSYKESIYYRHYFNVLCLMEPLDEFMSKTYSLLVPHVYIPEPSVMEVILNAVEVNDSIEDYLPKLWSDMKIFDHTSRETLLEIVLNMMHNTIIVGENENKGKEKFAEIAWDIWNKIETQPETRIKKLSFSGNMLGTILTLVLRNGDFEKACEVMNKLDSDRHLIAGIPKIESLASFIDRCIVEKQPSRAINCIQYSSECGFIEAEQFARKLNDELSLDGPHWNKLYKIVGERVLKKNNVDAVKDEVK